MEKITDKERDGLGRFKKGHHKKHSEETKQKMREKATGRNHSEETKNKLREINTGRKLSAETKRKISIANSGKPKPPRTEEHRRKMSLAKKGVPLDRVGDKNPSWKGGIKTDKHGYIYIYCPEHPSARAKYVREHRLVMEKRLGRYLTPEEVVHHIDFNKQNNNIDNLMLFETRKSHSSFHLKIRQFGMTNPIKRQIANRWEDINNQKSLQ